MSEQSWPPTAPPGAFLPPPRRSKRRQVIVLTVFLGLVAALFGVIWSQTRHNPEAARVGDCVRQTGADSVQVVDCGDPNAAFKVVGRVEDKTQVEASLSACDPYAGQGAKQAYWSGKLGEKGYVLCLAKNR
jgi:hypothetical protein